jgi:molecular chaperone GrpE
MSNTNSENDDEKTAPEIVTERDFIPSQEILDAEAQAEKDAAEIVSIQVDEEEDAAAQETPEDRVLVLEAQVAALQDKYLRTVAEMENVRRRTQVEKENASKFAIANFAREMLTVSDNMNRAFTSVEGEGRGENAKPSEISIQFKAFIEGVKMTENDLMKTLEKLGLKKIEPLGLRFDANLHEALFEFENKDQPTGTVAQVLEQGFTLNGRLLRPAKVGITKGGPQISPDPKEVSAADEVPTADEAPDVDVQSPYDLKATEPGSQLNEET